MIRCVKGMISRPLVARAWILVAALSLPPVLPGPQTGPDDARLAKILERAAGYCRKLDRAALDFVCLEEVTETSRNYSPRTEVYLYDYQFVRKQEEVRERRNLVAVNGRKAALDDVALHTLTVQYKNVLFGPIGLLSEYWQGHHVYRFAGEDAVHGEKTVVIEATPGSTAREPHPYGRIWIKESDGSVLKIVWDQRSLGNFRSIEEWAAKHDAEPLVTAYSEFRFEKNGLRFPNRIYMEQAYIRKNGRKSVFSESSVLYKDYKFFTVETEIKYDRGGPP